MLPKKYRLTKRGDFSKIWQRGKRSFIDVLGVKCLENGLANSRFAFIVSLKISKKAVQRNKVKRQLREIVQLHLTEIKSGYDVMVITRPGILDLDYQQLEEKLLSILGKLGLMGK